jgi:ABC-type nitrate/sulfonate/bicarbonate transport system permease component
MTSQDSTLDLAETSRLKWRHFAVTAGRIGLALLLLLAWKIGAERAGPIYIADPVLVLQRIVTDTMSGELLRHVYVTLRLSVVGFAIGCFFGVALPFLLRRLPRITNAVEPYIMASVGVPKYALVPLFILWFGIDDAPKLWLIGLLVFYPVFIAVFAGIRNVDRRLINMARVMGASEAMISREVIWQPPVSSTASPGPTTRPHSDRP